MSAAVIIHRQNKIIRAFREAEAFDANHAKTFEELNLRGNLARRTLINHEILIETSPDRFYLNAANADALPRKRMIRIAIACGIIALALIVLWLLT